MAAASSSSGPAHDVRDPGLAHDGSRPGPAHVGDPGPAHDGNRRPRQARRPRASAKAPADAPGLPPAAVPAAFVDLTGEDEEGPPGLVDECPNHLRRRRSAEWKKKDRECKKGGPQELPP